MPDDLQLSGLDPDRIHESKMANLNKKVKQPTEIQSKRLELAASKEDRLSKSSLTNHPPPGPPPPAVHSAEDRSTLLDQLLAYKERFPALKERNKISGKSTYEEIEDEMHNVKHQLGSKRDGNVGFMMFTGALTGLEMTTEHYFNPMNLKLTGMGQVAKDNYGEVEAIVDELMIKYGTGFYMSPEMRLVLAVSAMVATVHLANTGHPKLAQTLQAMNQRVVPPKAAKDL